MAISSLALDPSWRDYTGQYNALVEPSFAPLEESMCHAPRYCLVPDNQHQTIPAGGKISYNFHLVPGSVIVGFWINDAATAVQLTDIELQHEFFQEPLNSALMQTAGPSKGRMPSMTLLPCPHPVVGDGLFMFEAWGTPGDQVVMILAVAEVTDCPVR